MRCGAVRVPRFEMSTCPLLLSLSKLQIGVHPGKRPNESPQDEDSEAGPLIPETSRIGFGKSQKLSDEQFQAIMARLFNDELFEATMGRSFYGFEVEEPGNVIPLEFPDPLSEEDMRMKDLLRDLSEVMEEPDLYKDGEEIDLVALLKGHEGTPLTEEQYQDFFNMITEIEYQKRKKEKGEKEAARPNSPLVDESYERKLRGEIAEMLEPGNAYPLNT
jgi:hypothetical protein